MPRLRISLATLVLLACAACSPSADEPPTPAPPRSAAAASPTPSASVADEMASYSPEERAAYAGALPAYERFTAANDRFLAQGKTTKPASNFYQRYSIDWVDAWANLAQLANNDVTVKGRTRVLWVRPASIDVAPSGRATVRLLRCIDESQLSVRQAGQVVEQPQLQTPHVYQLRLIRKPSERHWRAGSAKQGKAC